MKFSVRNAGGGSLRAQGKGAAGAQRSPKILGIEWKLETFFHVFGTGTYPAGAYLLRPVADRRCGSSFLR